MNEKSWNDFEKTGKINDYLSYKLSNPNEINALINEGEIKPALPTDVGKSEHGEGFTKQHFMAYTDRKYADKNKGNRN